MREGPPGRREMKAFSGLWKRLQPRYRPEPAPTAVPHNELNRVIDHITTVPDGVAANPKVIEILRRRRDAVHGGRGIDWATAEALAFGTLLDEGESVRLNGQVSRGGKVSQ